MNQTSFPGEKVHSFTPSEIESIYDELGKLTVQLDDDPLAYGPKRLNLKVSLVRRALDRTEKIFLDISRRLQMARRSFRIAKVDFEMAKKHLFATDPETRAGRSVSDRDAIAAGKLRKEVDLLNDLEILVMDLEAVLEVVKAKRSDLKGTESRLKDQLRLCQEEIAIGHRWGSRVPDSSVDLQNGRPAVAEVGYVNDLLEAVDGEVHLAKAQGNWDGPSTEDGEEDASEESTPSTIILDEVPDELPEPPPVIGVRVGATVPEDTEDGNLPEVSPALKESVEDGGEEPSFGIEALIPAGNAEDAPATTATANDVDAFLDSMPMEGMSQTVEKGKGHVALVDESLSIFLADFESIE